jgi:hypothetical protein
MARKRVPHPPHTFDLQEIAVGSALSPQQIDTLIKRGVAPWPISGGGRGKGALLFDVAGLSEFAITGSAYWSGCELLPTARLASAIIDYLMLVYGHTQSRCYMNWNKLSSNADQLPPNEDGSRAIDDFNIHTLFRRFGPYEVGEAWKDDLFLEVFDRRYCFFGIPGGLRFPGSFGAKRNSDMEPMFRLDGWARGEEVTLHELPDLLPKGALDPDCSEEVRNAARAVEDEFYDARANPRGVFRVNLSLSIRNAFDRICDFRSSGSVEHDTS